MLRDLIRHTPCRSLIMIFIANKLYQKPFRLFPYVYKWRLSEAAYRELFIFLGVNSVVGLPKPSPTATIGAFQFAHIDPRLYALGHGIPRGSLGLVESLYALQESLPIGLRIGQTIHLVHAKQQAHEIAQLVFTQCSLVQHVE